LTTITSKSGLLILIEGNPYLSSQFTSRFERLGYKAVAMPNGVEAISFMRQHIILNDNPGLIVVNYDLPFQNGVEVCRQLKSDRRLGTVPVLIFSEQNQMTRMTESYKAKADYYVVVGKDIDTLEKRAQAILMRQVYK